MARAAMAWLGVAALVPALAACSGAADTAEADGKAAETGEIREVDLDSPDISIADETPLDPAGAQASDDRARAAAVDPLATPLPEAPPPAAETAGAPGSPTSQSTSQSTPGEAR